LVHKSTCQNVTPINELFLKSQQSRSRRDGPNNVCTYK
jgi:hypothetical protein